MVFRWSLWDGKFLQVIKTLLSILADLSSFDGSAYPLVSESSSPSINPLITVPNTPITTGISVAFMFLFFSVLQQSLSTCLLFLLIIFIFCSFLIFIFHTSGSRWFLTGVCVTASFIESIIIIIIDVFVCYFKITTVFDVEVTNMIWLLNPGEVLVKRYFVLLQERKYLLEMGFSTVNNNQ